MSIHAHTRIIGHKDDRRSHQAQYLENNYKGHAFYLVQELKVFIRQSDLQAYTVEFYTDREDYVVQGVLE